MDLLGDQPVTAERTVPTGDVARVPDFDESMVIRQTSFEGKEVLRPADVPSRPKGWRFINSNAFSVEIQNSSKIGKLDLAQHLTFQAAKSESSVTSAIVGQEVRSPFPGTYRLQAKFVAEGKSEEAQQAFQESHSCYLVFFKFAEKSKQIDQRTVMAEFEFVPEFADDATTTAQTVEFTRPFRNARGNYSFGLGMGVGVEIRQKPNATAATMDEDVALHVLSIELEFVGKERNPNIIV